MLNDLLIPMAKKAQARANPHISGYPVGAALDTPKGIFCGCNVECDIHTGCVHAEIAATTKALFQGAEKAYSIAVVVNGKPEYPCGFCRQILAEKWGTELEVIAVGSDSQKNAVLGELLPENFVREE